MKKHMRMLLALALIALVLLCGVAMAEEEITIVASGSCGTNVTWQLDSTWELTISGTGAMTNYSYYSSVPWYSNRASILKVTIEDGVTSIGNYAFEDCSSLESISIPDGVTSIGEFAFYECSSLESISIPDGVTSIGWDAFFGCSSLESISIPDSVTSIGDWAFYGCSSLESVSIPDSVTSIGEFTFFGCNSLESVNIPDSVTSIEYEAFYNCNALTDVYYAGTLAEWDEVEIEDGNECLLAVTIHCSDVDYIQDLTWAIDKNGVLTFSGNGYVNVSFEGNSEIKKVVIGAGVRGGLEAWDFLQCENIQSFEVDADNSVYCSVDGVLFSKDKTKLIAFPAGCDGSYTLPEGTEVIAEVAFAFNKGLTQVTLTEGLEEIGDNAFYGCTALGDVTLPKSLRSAGVGMFAGCTSMQNIFTKEDGYDPICAVDGVLFVEEGVLYAFPCGRSGKYTAENWVDYIECYAFKGASKIEEVSIGWASIYYEAFAYCSSLKKIYLSSEYIAERAFAGCKALTDVYYNGTKEEWEEVEIEDGNGCLLVATIHCSDGDIVPEDEPMELPEKALHLPANLTEIQKEAFLNSTAEYIVLPDGCKTIGSRAFADWELPEDELAYIYIPESVTRIADDAFEDSYVAIVCEAGSYADDFAWNQDMTCYYISK